MANSSGTHGGFSVEELPEKAMILWTHFSFIQSRTQELISSRLVIRIDIKIYEITLRYYQERESEVNINKKFHRVILSESYFICEIHLPIIYHLFT